MSSLTRQIKKLFGRKSRGPSITFTGDYSSWDAAKKDSSGYDDALILEKTRDALLKVKCGEAVFERDSVLFQKPQYPYPLISGLLRAAQVSGGRLSVLDFGGSLGSTFFQCRSFLAGVKEVEWLVIEQTGHVSCGRQYFEGHDLHFYASPQECLSNHRPNLLLLSSVLQYLPEPWVTLNQLLALQLPHLIVDRTAFLKSDRDRLTVQTVPESIYTASYPAWFFSETRFLKTIHEAGYLLIGDFAALDRLSPVDEPAYSKGFIFERRSATVA